MKLQAIYILFFFFLIFEKSKAQSVTISESVNVRNDNGYEIVGKHKGNILLFRDKLDNFEVNAFDEQMRLTWTHKLDFPEKKVTILDAVQGKDYFAVIYKAKVKSDFVVKVHRFDLNAKFIDSLTIKNYGNSFTSPIITSTFSEDKKVALIYSYENNTKLECASFDLENMKLLWSQNYSFAETKANDNFLQIIVENSGTAHFIYEKNEAASLFGVNQHEYHIYTLSENNHLHSKIPLNEYATYSIRFGYDNLNRQMVAVGLYSELSKSKASGTFFIKQKVNNPPKITYDAFSDELVTAVTGKKTTNNKGLNDLKVQELLLRKDGGAVAIIEEVKEFIRNTATTAMRNNDVLPSGRPFVSDYYHDNLIAVNFNAEGTGQWQKVMPKKQFSQDDEGVFSSYIVMKTPNQIRFLFNDDVRTETTTSEYVMGGNGNIDRHSMFNTSNQEILLRFRDGLQLSSDEIVIPSEHRSRLRLVRLRW